MRLTALSGATRISTATALLPGRHTAHCNDWHDDVFFVAEPEAQVVVRFGRSARLLGEVGYRATSESTLNGVSGSISMQFGR